MSESEATKLALAGTNLSAEEAAKLEENLKRDPDDLVARVKLLGYYLLRQYQSGQDRKARQRHVLWIIRNAPESEIAGTPYIHLDPVLDTEAFKQGKNLWIQKSKSDASAKVLGHAANFFTIHEPERSEEFLKRAIAKEPKAVEWHRSLGTSYFRMMSFETDTVERKRLAGQALESFETARSISRKTNEHESEFLLEHAAQAAYEAGDSNKATSYANELLEIPLSSREAGNAIHYGNSVLGRLALASGNTAEAERYLIESAKTPGSPNLNSFGPQMILARELLEAGEKDVVLEYLDLCSAFWRSGQTKLSAWKAEITEGKVPDFGSNLY